MTMLDFAGTLVITAVMVTVINAAVGVIALPRLQKLVVVAAIGLWVGFAAGAAGMGWLRIADPVPVIGLVFAAPLLAATVAVLSSPPLRNAVMAMPIGLLIGLHATRVLGIFFLLLEEQGRLSGPFPVYAGWGDIIAGILAIPVALVLARRPAPGRVIAMGWNLFGAADLVIAVSLGVTSAAGSPLHIFAVGAGSEAMQVLPWSFVPTVLVPFFLLLHAAIAIQLFHAGKEENAPANALQQA